MTTGESREFILTSAGWRRVYEGQWPGAVGTFNAGPQEKETVSEEKKRLEWHQKRPGSVVLDCVQEMAAELAKSTFRGKILTLVVTEEAGDALGIRPGESLTISTSAGPVQVNSKRCDSPLRHPTLRALVPPSVPELPVWVVMAVDAERGVITAEDISGARVQRIEVGVDNARYYDVGQHVMLAASESAFAGIDRSVAPPSQTPVTWAVARSRLYANLSFGDPPEETVASTAARIAAEDDDPPPF